jgi:hypothetical protein
MNDKLDKKLETTNTTCDSDFNVQEIEPVIAPGIDIESSDLSTKAYTTSILTVCRCS